MPFSTGGFSLESFDFQKAVRKGPLPLAVLAQGVFPDSTAGKPVPAWPSPQGPEGTEVKKEETAAPVKPAPGKLVLVGAASIFQRQLLQAGGHGAFFLNTVDVLTLGDELVEIRSKQAPDTTIGKVSTEEKLGWRLFTTLFMPALLVIAGTSRIWLRSRAKQNYLKTLTV